MAQEGLPIEVKKTGYQIPETVYVQKTTQLPESTPEQPVVKPTLTQKFRKAIDTKVANIKSDVSKTIQTTKSNAVKAVSYKNIKKVGNDIIKNVGTNLNNPDIFAEKREKTTKKKSSKKQVSKIEIPSQDFKRQSIHDIGVIPDIFDTPKSKSLKPLKMKKQNLNNINDMFKNDMFKRRKGGLF